MLKTTSTLPYLAALLAANTVGLELVSANQCTKDKQVPGTRQDNRRVSDGQNKTIDRLAHRLSNALPLSRDVERIEPTQSDLPPLFGRSDKSSSIRRLYPSKSRGSAALAVARTDRRISHGKHSKHSSMSSGFSVQETPSPVADLRPREDIKSPLTRHAGRHKRGPSLPVITGSIGRTSSLKRSKSFEISEDTGYGTMNTMVSVKPDVVEIPTVPTPAKDPDQTPTKAVPRPTTSSSFRPDSSQSTSTFSKGHHRAQSSIASIWDLDVDEVPSPPIKRRPLQLNTRPPLPNFNTPPGSSRHDLMQPPCKTPVRSSLVSAKWMSPTKDDTPKGLNRHSSINTNRQSVLSSHASESWDEDFSELALEVPESIRESQATLRGHLWQLQQFSNQITELKFLREKYYSPESSSRIWHETDALLAIASQEDENGLTYNHDPTHDDMISELLGIEPGYTGKVRLDGDILETLVYKADCLIGDICAAFMV